MNSRIILIGLKLPMVSPGDDLVGLLLESMARENIELEDGDVLAITLKIVSKSMGLLVDIRSIEPSREAIKIANKTGLDPRVVELILRESDSIVAAVPFEAIVRNKILDLTRYSKDPNKALKAVKYYPTILITVRDGMLWSDSGIDTSNHPPNIYSIPPRNIDEVAKKISMEIFERTGKNIAIVLCDTELFPWGAMDIARGCYGIEPLTSEFGEYDMYGKPKFGGIDNIVHEICGAAGLIMRQGAEGIPAVLIKGLKYKWFNGGLKDKSIGLDQLRGGLKLTIKHTRRVIGLRRILRMICKYFSI